MKKKKKRKKFCQITLNTEDLGPKRTAYPGRESRTLQTPVFNNPNILRIWLNFRCFINYI